MVHARLVVEMWLWTASNITNYHQPTNLQNHKTTEPQTTEPQTTAPVTTERDLIMDMLITKEDLMMNMLTLRPSAWQPGGPKGGCGL